MYMCYNYAGYSKCPYVSHTSHTPYHPRVNHCFDLIFQTNHPAFPLFHSRVRRRYSEFVWLRNKLGLDDVVMM